MVVKSALLKASEAAVVSAREAALAYSTWMYAHPKASMRECLTEQLRLAQKNKLDSEAKAYFSVLVNEYHAGSISGKEDAR